MTMLRITIKSLALASCLFQLRTAALVAPSHQYSARQIPTKPPQWSSRARRHYLDTTTRLFQTTASSQGKKRFATSMAFLTGWADIALFTKYRAFATMMTGNTMWMALATVEQRYRDVGFYASVIASYVAGLVAFRRADLTLKNRSLRVCALVVTLLFVGSDYLHYSRGGARWLPMMMLAGAFGVINSVGTEVAGTLTFVITGHMTKLTNQVVDRVSRTAGRKKLTEADKALAMLNSAMVGGFFGGAAFASVLLAREWLHQWGIFSLLGILYGTLFMMQDMELLHGAWWLRKDGAMCDDIDDDGEVCDIEEEEEND